MTRRLHLWAALLACVGALALGCGVAMAAASGGARPAVAAHSVPAAELHGGAVAHAESATAVAKFLLHAGIAYYVFDHYIWKPFKAGHLHGFFHALTIAKAAVAALFVYHEVKEMAADVKQSKLLRFLTSPIALAIRSLESLKSAITGGSLNPISAVHGQLGTVQSQAHGKGYVIKEIVHAL